ncbi:hypothetical protein HYT53_06175 [Candidatus Woesearchaeota archaeon]|nr:hypothetical protein [Candidatus Woesearchaeota archaeon]
MFWKKDNTEKSLRQMNDLLKKSFANVKRDTTNIFQWINYFYRRSVEQEQLVKRLQLELSYMPRTRDDIRRIIDDYYSFEGIMSRIRELNGKVEALAVERQSERHAVQQVQPQREIMDLSHIEKRLQMLEQKKPSMREKIIKRLTRNSKEYVKSVMLSYIKKYGKISALQLKEMVVDEQNLCSKSSFYRLLEELEEIDDIGVIRQGKEKHYISKAKVFH